MTQADAVRDIQHQAERFDFNTRGVGWIKHYASMVPTTDVTINSGISAASLQGNAEAKALLNKAARDMWPMIVARALAMAAEANDDAIEIIRKKNGEL